MKKNCPSENQLSVSSADAADNFVQPCSLWYIQIYKKEISKCLPSGKFLPIRQWWQKNSAYLDFTYFNNITVDVDFNQIEPIFIILWTKHGSLVKKIRYVSKGVGNIGVQCHPHPQIIFVPPSLNWICAPLINVCTPSHKLVSIIELMRLVINKLTNLAPN